MDISCTEGGVTVGRGAGSALHLDCPTVSGSHARLERADGDYWVTDLGSQYGTFLNGKQLAPGARARLQPGDHLRFGLTEHAAGAAGSNNCFKVCMWGWGGVG